MCGGRWRLTLCVALAVDVFCTQSLSVADNAPAPSYAQTALEEMQRGDYVSAARQTRLAMQEDPGDGTLYALAGAMLLRCNQTPAAETAFRAALVCDQDDSLALYGLSLARLARGDRRGAGTELDRAERAGGDRSCLLVARRYGQWLDGAQVSMRDAGVSDGLEPAARALDGMSALRRGDAASASADLEAALKALPGDGVREPEGPLLTFDPSHPLAGHNVKEGALGVVAAEQPRRGVRGVVDLAPQEPETDAAYATFELDGRSLSLVNVRPFTFTWDSAQASNGRHSLQIVLYDAHGREVSRATRSIIVSNPAAGGSVSALRASLWQALAPCPDRAACALALGRLRLAQHDTEGARGWFERAAAVRPDAETHHLLAVCGGLAIPAEALWGGRPDEKVVALTFDDGPKPGVTEPLLDLLIQERVPGTFFVIGRHVMEYPDLTRRIAQSGMEIANHSYTHPNLTHLTPEEAACEVMQTQAAVALTTGVRPRYLRPPGGNWNPQVAGIVRSWGLTPCMWTVDAYSSEVIGPQQTANAVLQQVQPGSIILMHNGTLSTLEALPTIIHELRSRGYSFATVSALAHRLDMARAEAQRAGHEPGRRLSPTE